MTSKNLTQAQISTLLRLRTDKYIARHDGKRGMERRVEGRYAYRDVNCPSLPVLMREGYVDYISAKDPVDREKGKWYYVALTEKGWKAVKEELNNG